MTWFEFSKDKMHTTIRRGCLGGRRDDESLESGYKDNIRVAKILENQSQKVRNLGRCKKAQ